MHHRARKPGSFRNHVVHRQLPELGIRARSFFPFTKTGVDHAADSCSTMDRVMTSTSSSIQIPSEKYSLRNLCGPDQLKNKPIGSEYLTLTLRPSSFFSLFFVPCLIWIDSRGNVNFHRGITQLPAPFFYRRKSIWGFQIDLTARAPKWISIATRGNRSSIYGVCRKKL